MASGTEAISKLTNRDSKAATEPNSEIVNFEDLEPSVLRFDIVE